MNGLIALLTSLSATIANLPPHEMTSDLSSDVATYDGEILTLEGSVILDHELGQMEAGMATLEKKEGTAEIPFSQIFLQNDVFISFQTQAELTCDTAHFDFQNLMGTFFSNDSPAVYRDNKKAFELFAHEFDLTLTKEEGTCKVNTMRANQSCHLIHLDDHVDADRITMDLKTHTVTMENPDGIVSSFFFPEVPERKCHVTSNSLTWDQDQDTLSLEGNILLEDGHMGKLIGTKCVSLQQKMHLGKKVIQKMEAQGETTLTSHDGQKITSFGTLTLDRDNLELVAISPVVNGVTPIEEQLIFEKDDLILYADTASLEYSLKDLALQPHLVYLHGHVRIFSKEPSERLKCGIADHVQYDPTTLEIRLYADKGKRAYFWHEKQNLKLSAPEILITLGPETKEETINGIGIVSFTFNQEEDEHLHNLFPHYKTGNQ